MEGKLPKNYVKDAPGKMICIKTIGSDGLTNAFFKTFFIWTQDLFVITPWKWFLSGELSISQKQAVIKLIEKTTEIKDWSKTGDQYLYLILIQYCCLKLSLN